MWKNCKKNISEARLQNKNKCEAGRNPCDKLQSGGKKHTHRGIIRKDIILFYIIFLEGRGVLGPS